MMKLNSKLLNGVSKVPRKWCALLVLTCLVPFTVYLSAQTVKLPATLEVKELATTGPGGSLWCWAGLMSGTGCIGAASAAGTPTTLSWPTTNPTPGQVWTAGTVSGGIIPTSWTTILTTALTSAHLFVGNGSNVATDVAVTGAITISNTGLTAIASSVALPGSPTTTTQSPGDNSTKVATTAFVLANAPTSTLTSAHLFVGNGSNVATDTAVTGDVTIGNTGVTAIKTNVALAGSPTTTTQSAGDNTTKVATTAFVDAVRVSQSRRLCDIAIGDESAAAVTNSQLGPQTRVCFIPAASTIVEMDVAADGGTPNVIVGKNHAGSISNIVSSALATAGSGGIACSNTGGTTGIDGTTTCTNTLQNTSLAAGDYLELVSGTAGGTAKLMTIHVIYTIN